MKSLYSSKTFWIAVLQGFVGILVALMTIYPEVGGLIVLKSVTDIVLRIVTETKVSV